MGFTYKCAGVDIDAGKKAVAMIKKDVEATFSPAVLGGLGGFGGLFAPDLTGWKRPVLVAGTDGVGSKLKVAFMQQQHTTVGIDLVAMCVNDILAQGAKPLFFLDYLAIGQLEPARVAEIVQGISKGCQEAGCSLIGGETAELPDFYQKGEYDLAGFVVGIVEHDKIITGEGIRPGDQLIGLASSGLHSNGYSLVRKLFFEAGDYQLTERPDGLEVSLGEELLKPTRIYVKSVLALLNKYRVKGMAHITGGGLIENIPRILPTGCQVSIKKGSWPVPPIFKLIERIGGVAEEEMYRTFNMGIGLVLIVAAEEAEEIRQMAESLGEKAYRLGEVIKGEQGLTIK